MKLSLLAAVLLWAVPATAQVAILHLQVIEGEGAVHLPGSHSARPLTVEVTDETGKPVAGAAVSFHLPEEGPGGTFGSGLRTDVAVTDNRGRASLHSLQLNHTPGRFQVRIVAIREQARAGIVSLQYIGEAKSGASPTPAAASAPAPANNKPAASRGVLKWVVLVALAGGAAAAGVLTAGKSGGASAPAASPSTTPSITIGSPSVTVGKP